MTRLRDADQFLRNITPNTGNVLFLLLMGANNTTIMSLQNFFYVFDSQSRDKKGLNNPNGQLVLLKFRYIFEIEKYVQVTYLEFKDKQRLYFQGQFIILRTEAVDLLSIFSIHQNSFRCKNYQNN